MASQLAEHRERPADAEARSGLWRGWRGQRGWRGWRALGLSAAVAVAYAALSEVAFRWFDADGTDASFFPAAGVTMAALLVLDRRWWLSVVAGAGAAEIVIDLWHGIGWSASVGYAIANLIQPLVGAVVLRRLVGQIDMARLSHLASFIAVAVVAAPLVGGLVGAGVHHLLADGTGGWGFAAQWWIGDGLGVLVVGSTLVSFRATTSPGAVPAGVPERVVLVAAAIAATFLSFRLEWFALVYVPLALLFVTAVRCGTRDVALAGALIAFVAAEGTSRGHRFWAVVDAGDDAGLLYLQLALSVVICSALVLAAALAEREASSLARGRAETARSEEVNARRRAELLGRLGEALARATRPADVWTTVAAFGLDRAWSDTVTLDASAFVRPVDRDAGADGLDGADRDERPSRDVIEDAMVVDVARRMVLDVLGRVRLIEDERAARRRAEMLEHHAAQLAAAVSVDAVANATVEAMLELGVRWAALWRLDGEVLTMAATAGEAGATTATYRCVTLDEELPVTEAVLGRVVVACQTRAELLLRFPSVRLRGGASTPVETVVVVPLHAQNLHVVGALAVTADDAHWLDDERRQVLLSLADQCGLALDRAELQAQAERAAEDAELLARLSDALDRSTTAEDKARHVVTELVRRGAGAVSVEIADDDEQRVLAASGSATDLLAAEHHVLLQARGRVLGRLVVGPGDLGRTGRSLVQAIASRAAIAIDNALLYERERDVSHRLQMGLLDVSFPAVAGLRIDGAYRPGTATLDIGGDWHDAFVLPTGHVALVVGDVVGHGLEAAIAMAQLRGAVRALAAVSSPSELLDRLDAFVDSLPDADMTTLVYVELDPHSGSFRYACAGHPPPLVVSATGVSRLAWGGRSTPLGSHFRSRRVESIDSLGEAERLVLYTDGLVERRGEQLDVGLTRLLRTSAHDVASVDFVDSICDRLLVDVPQRDDVCVLTATRLDGRSFARSLRTEPSDLVALRRELRAWLSAWVPDEAARHDVLLAVSEAVANAVEHGASEHSERPVVVVATVHPGPTGHRGEVRVTVRDHGVWREPVPSVERGRGIGIMRALMDDVAVERHDDGTVVRLRLAVRH